MQWRARTSNDATPQREWAATLAAMEQDPSRMLLFLAERQTGREGTWDYRWLSEPGRHVWATIRFEMALPTPPFPEAADSALPTLAEISAGYHAMNLDELATEAETLQHLQALGTASNARHAASVQVFTAAAGRIAAARTAYCVAHRAELERIQ
jgi:hypothetical protein